MLDDLPSLDISSDEALTESAERRAAVALHRADGPLTFAGLSLTLTISRKSLYLMLQRADGALETGGQRVERDAIILLYLASQNPETWSAPRVEDGVLREPLRARPADWLREIDLWADAAFKTADLDDVVEAAERLWELHHATRPAVMEEPGPAQKKTEETSRFGNIESPAPPPNPCA